MRAVASALALAGLLGARAAGAQPVDNDYAIDLFQGPILAPTRVTAMGGAYAGYAEGIAGFVANAASPAVREGASRSWLELDIDASFSVPIPLFENDDFDNSGDLDSDYTNFIYLSAGGLIQAGNFGTGFFADLQHYTVSFPPDERETIVTVGRYHVLAGWQFLGDQLVVGGGVRALTLGLTSDDGDLAVFGIAPQIGVLVRPDWTPFRVGATYRFAVDGGTLIGDSLLGEDGVRRAGGLVLPNSVELPWELEAGIALQVGPRPLNPRWINPHDDEDALRESYAQRRRTRAHDRERQLVAFADPAARAALRQRLLNEEALLVQREQFELERDLERLKDERKARALNWPRDAILLTADLKVSGEVEDAIHLERFLGQAQEQAAAPCAAIASGTEVNFSPRAGVEVEPVPEWVHTRFGTYYEPNRYRYSEPCSDNRGGRQHFTFGGDVKLLSTTWWGLVPEVTYKLQAYGDLAPRFQSFGAGFGVWY